MRKYEKASKNLLKAGTKPVIHTTQLKHDKPECPSAYQANNSKDLQ
jgi:hypothetical protein